MTSGMYKVTAKFLNARGGPLTGAGIAAGLRDKDRFFDDKLGVCTLNSRGEAELILDKAPAFGSPSQDQWHDVVIGDTDHVDRDRGNA